MTGEVFIFVMAGLVPAIPLSEACLTNGITGTSPVMTV
jgi:hypothetical protein